MIGRAKDLEVVVIGASAGAVEALSLIFPRLPASFPLPIAIVVHVPADAPSRLAEFFSSKCALKIVEAEDKMALRPGTIAFAPPDYHLLLESNRTLALNVDGPVNYSRPSIDVLFESSVDAFGSAVLGVLLTGASADGARGLKRIADAGGIAVVQDPATALASAMPAAAIALFAPRFVLGVAEIANLLASLGTDRGQT